MEKILLTGGAGYIGTHTAHSPIDSSCTPEIHAMKSAAKLAEKEARQNA